MNGINRDKIIHGKLQSKGHILPLTPHYGTYCSALNGTLSWSRAHSRFY